MNPGWKLGRAEGTPPLFTLPEEALAQFREFCAVDLQLQPRTIRNHVGVIRRFLEQMKKPLSQVSTDDLQSYLKGYLDKSTHAYANQVKSFRRFFRDFLGKDHLIESFRLPQHSYAPKIVPSKKQLQMFYWSLDSRRDKALFLMFATTGLRKAEALSLTFDDIDRTKRMVYPKIHGRNGNTKRNWVSFYNEETEVALTKYLTLKKDDDAKVFSLSVKNTLKTWKKVAKKTGIQISPQILRD